MDGVCDVCGAMYVGQDTLSEFFEDGWVCASHLIEQEEEPSDVE